MHISKFQFVTIFCVVGSAFAQNNQSINATGSCVEGNCTVGANINLPVTNSSISLEEISKSLNETITRLIAESSNITAGDNSTWLEWLNNSVPIDPAISRGNNTTDVSIASTAEGKRLNNIVLTLPSVNPNEPGSAYNSSLVSALPPGLPIILTKLNVECGSACSQNETSRSAFTEQLEQDIKGALEEKGLKPGNETIQILNIVSLADGKTESKFTIVQFAIRPLPDGTKPEDAVKAFKEQLDDPNSYLRSRGQITRNADPDVFNVDTTSLDDDGKVNEQSSDMPNTMSIALISLGCFTVLAISLGVWYKRAVVAKRKDEQSPSPGDDDVSGGTSEEEKSWYFKSIKIEGTKNNADSEDLKLSEVISKDDDEFGNLSTLFLEAVVDSRINSVK